MVRYKKISNIKNDKYLFLPLLDGIIIDYDKNNKSSIIHEMTTFNIFHSNKCFLFFKQYIDKNTIIIDLTGCIGGLTLSLRHYCDNVILSCELDNNRSKILDYHIKKYHNNSKTPINTFAFNDNSMDFIKALFDNDEEYICHKLVDLTMDEMLLKAIKNKKKYLIIIDPPFVDDKVDYNTIHNDNMKMIKYGNNVFIPKTIKLTFDNKPLKKVIKDIYKMNNNCQIIINCPYNLDMIKNDISYYSYWFGTQKNIIVVSKNSDCYVVKTKNSSCVLWNTYNKFH